VTNGKGRRVGTRRLVFYGALLALSAGVNIWTYVWCKRLEPDGCIPVHLIVTFPVMVFAALGFLVALISWLVGRHRASDP
jgi:hypothetical protein